MVVGTRGDTRDVGTAPGASASESGSSKRARRKPSRWAVAVTALATLLIVLLVGAALLLMYEREISGRSEQRQAALDAAHRFANELMTIDATNAQAKVEILIRDSTGPYHEHLVKNAGGIRSSLAAASAVASGTVAGAGLETLDGDSASALVVLPTPVDVLLSGGSSSSLRLLLRLQHEGDRWLVSAVEVLS